MQQLQQEREKMKIKNLFYITPTDNYFTIAFKGILAIIGLLGAIVVGPYLVAIIGILVVGGSVFMKSDAQIAREKKYANHAKAQKAAAKREARTKK